MSNLYWDSFKTFFKIGIFTLGGGYAMIPLIEEEVVNKKQWVSKDEMLDLIAIAQSCPGVFAINIATFIGYKLKKERGAIATTIGTALPSFLIILLIAMFFHQFEDNRIVAAIFKGIRPAVGYPSLPDASLNFILDDLLDMKQIGIRLTESGAMKPHASVSGLMLAHPKARYFSVGKIGEDQLGDYARRRGLPIELCRKFLAANL